MSFLLSNSYLLAAAPYAAVGGVCIGIIGVALALWAHRRMSRLQLRSTDSLEDTLGELTRRVREMQVFREDLEEYLKIAEQRIQRGVRGVGLIRFNPFEGDGSGGNQSFATAFLDERHHGVVFSAIYTRGGSSSIYAKPVEKGISPFELTQEEQEAIRRAIEGIKGNAHASKQK